MLLYTRIANYYTIFDIPNARSSHTVPTIRGGGVVFVFSIFLAGILYPVYWLPVLATSIIGLIGFVDDRKGVSKKLRFLFQVFTLSMLFYYLDLFSFLSIIGIILFYILFVGIINAYNFMDGINGITGLYSTAVLGALQYVNLNQFPFIEPDLIWFPLLSCLVFLYFNFRKRALCFPGDVGSISIAFWIVFLILEVIIETNNLIYLLFLTVYGVDTVLTIIYRLFLRQNIFEAHRLHFFQFLANEQHIPHIWVSVLYTVIQVLIIMFVVSTEANTFTALLVVAMPLVVVYVWLKPFRIGC